VKTSPQHLRIEAVGVDSTKELPVNQHVTFLTTCKGEKDLFLKKNQGEEEEEKRRKEPRENSLKMLTFAGLKLHESSVTKHLLPIGNLLRGRENVCVDIDCQLPLFPSRRRFIMLVQGHQTAKWMRKVANTEMSP
jgi:hypothetical protein